MNLESHARRVHGDHEYAASRALHLIAPIGTVWSLLTRCGDEGRQPTILELRQIATELDRVEELLGQQVTRLINLTDDVRAFAEAVNDALADAVPVPVAPEWATGQTGIDDDVVDRMARYYTQKGHDIR